MLLRSYLATRSWNALFVSEREILAERKYLFLYLNFTDDMENDKIVSNGHKYKSSTYQDLRVLGFWPFPSSHLHCLECSLAVSGPEPTWGRLESMV